MKVSVVIPVGPNPAYLQWLGEAIESVINQTVHANIVLIDDGNQLSIEVLRPIFGKLEGYTRSREGIYTLIAEKANFLLYKSPCRLGVASVFNVGVALSPTNCVFMMGSDDVLMPTCLEECQAAYIKHNEKDAWYNVTVVTQSGEEAWIPNHAAMVTKGLFEWFERGNGYYGFPPSAGIGGPDALLLSILMKHAPEKIIQVNQDKPLYWVREHEHQMTFQDASFFLEEMVSVRNKETERFKLND